MQRVRRLTLPRLEPYRQTFLGAKSSLFIRQAFSELKLPVTLKARRVADQTRFNFYQDTVRSGLRFSLAPVVARTSGGLPKSRRVWSVLKSAHVHNKARDQYELVTHRYSCQVFTFLPSVASLVALVLHRVLKASGLLGSRVRFVRYGRQPLLLS